MHRPDGIEEVSHCVLVVRNWAGRRDTEAPRHRGAETQTRTASSKAKASGRADVAIYITSTVSQTLLLTDGAEIVIETGTGY